jgi:hypothetical protein
MKKIYYFILVVASGITGCYKRDVRGFDEGYWLSKERGEVVYSDNYCNYYI